MIRQFELVEMVRAYDPQVDESLLNRAYVFSMKAHGSQTRASGDPYFSHPLEVAGILTGMRLDGDTIATALLHDTVEDTVATIEEIEELFGDNVARLVDGVTKLSRIEIPAESHVQAENFRKFVLAMSNDIRVLLVKLADRLHNMRTLHHIDDPEKRHRIALETMEIYAPLAERIGMREMQDELEDIAFRELNPEAYESITARMAFLRKEGGNIERTVISQLSKALKEFGIKPKISGREKRPYSIWKKMERYHISFEQLTDVMAFRIIVKDIPACYQTLGIVHGKWPMIPDRFKDYISTPKGNNYRSIHTSVIGPERQRIEIQIRTQEMHDIAELGVAAHWKYKQGAKSMDGSQYRWLRELLEILEQASSPEEFLEHTKLAMFQDQVFCFTPKGDLISLPRGSTVVDFAYAVHTDVGDSCVGAKVNGRMVPLRHQLQNGDQVEILRSEAQRPSPRWESFVITGKARSAIRRFVRNRQREEYQLLGRSILEKAFQQEELDFAEEPLTDALSKFRLEKLGDLYIHVGQGLLSETQVLRTIFPGIEIKGDHFAIPPAIREWDAEDVDKRHAVPIKGLTPGMAVHLADCCNPLPGDRIVGVIEPGQGVMVHTIDCEALADQSETQEGWLDLAWQPQSEKPDFYAGRLKLLAANEAGALAGMTTVVAKHSGNISNLKITTRDPDFFTFEMDVEVLDVKHLTQIMTALRANHAVTSVERLRG